MFFADCKKEKPQRRVQQAEVLPNSWYLWGLRLVRPSTADCIGEIADKGKRGIYVRRAAVAGSAVRP